MRALIRLTVPLVMALGLAACASTMPTVYAPAGEDGRRGYAEQRIEADRFRVQFHAGSDMTIGEAEDMALTRAAQLTLENGGDWFLVVSRSREGNDRDPVRTTGSVGYSTGGRYSGSSVGIGLIFDAAAGEKTAYLEILIRSGEREIGPDAYDAREVIANNPACGCDIAVFE